MRSAAFVAMLFSILLIPVQSAWTQDKGKKKGGGGGGGSTTVTTTYSGRAKVVATAVLGVNTTVCDTGDLPASGGAVESSALSAGVAGVVSTGVCHATSVGQGAYCRSESSVSGLSVSVGLNTITCGFAMSRASASVDANGNATATGCSELTALSINGNAIAITGAANQENVSFLGLRVIINQQVSTSSGASAEITVCALRIILTDILLGTTLADVQVCSSKAGITGGDTHAEVRDFLTGGGFITGTPSGDKGNFGVAGGIKNGALWGHLNYIDHGTGMHVKHTSITAYEATSANERRISGTCRINGVDGFGFSVFAADNGEPGSSDTFNIFLSNGYSAGGYLIGGNIQLHR
ncbi:MAG TPA: choice-of-anchor P family protein [Gemmatimonadales bacterium]|nr:choice-of-anchor P family protein [Gemmatimonadales bacterium]